MDTLLEPFGRVGAVSSFVARLLAGIALIALGIVFWGRELAELALPLIRWIYGLLDREHRIKELVLSSSGVVNGADHVYRLTVVPHRTVMVGTHVLHPHPQAWAKVSVIVAYLWQTAATAAVLLLAWPASRAFQWVFRFLLLLLMTLALIPIDLPFVLWAQVWINYHERFTPGDFSALLLWNDFLQHGGRWLIGLMLAILIIRLQPYADFGERFNRMITTARKSKGERNVYENI